MNKPTNEELVLFHNMVQYFLDTAEETGAASTQYIKALEEVRGSAPLPRKSAG